MIPSPVMRGPAVGFFLKVPNIDSISDGSFSSSAEGIGCWMPAALAAFLMVDWMRSNRSSSACGSIQ